MTASVSQVLDVFRRHRKTRGSKAVRRRGVAATRRRIALQREQLEQRLALAVGWIPSASPGNTQVIYSTEGSDIYVQQVATNPQNLIIADNPSFNNYLTIPDIDGANNGRVSVVQGAFTQVIDLQRTGLGSETTTRHLLRRGSVLDDTFAGGVISYGGATWSFSSAGPENSTGEMVPQPRSGSAPTSLIRPLAVRLVDAGEENRPGPSQLDVRVGRNAVLEIQWNLPPLNTATLYPEIQTVQYSWAGAGSGSGTDILTSLRASASPSGSSFNVTSFQLPLGPQSLGVLPSTVQGSFTVQDPGTFPRTMYFRASSPTSTTGSLFSLEFDDVLSFPSNDPFFTLSTRVADNHAGLDPLRRREVTGTLDASTGTLTLSFFTANDVRLPVDPGQVSLSATYLVPERSANPIAFTLAAGQTFSRPLTVDLATPNSNVNFNSAASLAGAVALSATNINFNSPLTTTGRMDIGPSPNAGQVWGRSAVAFADVAGSVVSHIAVPHGLGGVGYRVPPRVTIAAPLGDGLQATATAVVEAGRVVSITINFPGAGYTAIPAVTIDPPEGLDELDFTVPANGVTLTLQGDVRQRVSVGREVELRSSLLPNGPWVRRTVIDVQLDSTTGTPVTKVTLSAEIDLSTTAGRLAVYASLPSTVPESVNFNSAVSASTYDIRVADDHNTTGVRRGRLFVSSTGSLAGSNSVFVQADTADIVVEGTIKAGQQSYLMRSPVEDAGRAPFLFTTVSPTTGSPTGQIIGTNVAITLGNELLSPDADGALANKVDIKTNITSLRVTAAGKSTASSAFPYDLTVSEVDSVNIDAVAASSGRISLAARDAVTFNSALVTDGDVAITVDQGAFDVAAPISTSRGSITISATSVNVRNSLRVLDARPDALRDDITLVATGGSLNLSGQIAAVNGLRLQQKNPSTGGGAISGDTRLAAQRATLDAQGQINVRTALESLVATSIGDLSIDELDDIAIPSLRSDGFVTLRAGGVDPGLNNVFSPNQIALLARLQGVSSFSASAPRGSVEVITNSDLPVSLGNGALISSGKATAMQAAGAVTIRSTASSIDVADAPTAGGSAEEVRVVARENLAAKFALNDPGFISSTLTADSPGTLRIDGLSLRAGEQMLVQGQDDKHANGIYRVTFPGSDLRPWALTRSAAFDTSPEFRPNTYVRVLEGSNAGSVWKASFDTTFGETPISVTPVANVGRSQRVRVATTTVLQGTYDPADLTIDGSGQLPVIDGVTLTVGDRVLVRLGAAQMLPAGLPTAAANGVYEVTNVGSDGTWSLTRARDRDTNDVLERGYVTTEEGTFRAATTGQAFLLDYDSLGTDPLILAQVSDLRTNIGTDNINAKVQLLVSSNSGTNNSAGSLGRMITIQERNDVRGTPNNAQTSNILFSSLLTGPIALEQELPFVENRYSIDASNRIRPVGFHTTKAGSTQLLVDSVAGLQIGMLVTGPGLLDGTFISSIAPPNAITLSQGASNSAVPGPGEGQFRFFSPTATFPGTASDRAISINPAPTPLPSIGQKIYGPGIPVGTTLVSVNADFLPVVRLDLSNAIVGTPPANSTYRTFPATTVGGLVRPSGATSAEPIVINGQNISLTRNGGGIFRQTGAATVVAPAEGQPVLQLAIALSFRDFQDVLEGMIVSGNGIRPGSMVTDIDRNSRRITLDQPIDLAPGSQPTITIATEISGLVFNGPNAGAARLGGVYIGGFESGAAVKVATISNKAVVIDAVEVGRDPRGGRLGNLFGISVDGVAAEKSTLPNLPTVATAKVQNSTVVFSTGIGIRTIGNADVDVAGTEVGVLGNSNTLGIELGGTGQVRLGDPPNSRITSARVRLTEIAGVEVGAAVTGPAAGVSAGAIVPLGTRVTTVVRDSTTAGGFVVLDQPVTYRDGHELTFTNLTGSTVNRTLSTRTLIRGNQRGIDIRSGGVTIQNTTVANSNFDAVRIFGAQTLEKQPVYQIGNESQALDGRSNLFVNNGAFGIRFVTPLALPPDVRDDSNPEPRWIRGNMFAVTTDAGDVERNGNGSVIYQETNDSAARLTTPSGFRPGPSGLDRHGNLHAPTPPNPTIFISSPLDNSQVDRDPDIDNVVRVRGAEAAIERISLQLEDDLDAIDIGTVMSRAFTVRFSESLSVVDWQGADVVEWVDGTNYSFDYDAATQRVTFNVRGGLPAGSYLIRVDNSPETGVRDQDGNTLLPNGVADTDDDESTTAFVVVVDIGPRIRITSNTSSLGVGQSALITFELPGNSTDFDRDDIVSVGGELTNFTGSGAIYTATFTPPPNSTTTGTISVAAERFTINGLGNLPGALSVPIAIDTVVRPSVGITSTSTALRRGQTATITFTLSEDSTDFDADDVTTSGGELAGFTGFGRVYTATFTPTDNSTEPGSIAVFAGRFTNASGVTNRAGSLATPIAINTLAQTAVITASRATLRVGQTALVTFTLTEPSINFSRDVVTVVGGTLSSFSGAGAIYFATFTPTLNSTTPGMISVAGGTFTDSQGSPNVASSLATPILIDTAAPTITIESSATTLRAGQTATITFTLSEPATNFTVNSVSVTGGILSAFTGSGADYSATFTPMANSTTPGMISVAAGAFTDSLGNPNVAHPLSPSISIDTVRPTIVITGSVGSLGAGQTATITFTLSENSSNFSLADVVVGGGALSAFVGSGSAYTATFTPAANSSAPGTIAVLAGAFTDLAGNTNVAGTLTPTISIDTVAPSVMSITSSAMTLRSGEIATITIRLSEDSPNFGVDKIDVTGGTLSNFTGSGNEYSAVFTPLPNSTASGTVAVAAGVFTDAAGNANLEGVLAAPILIDTVNPVIVGFSSPSGDTTAGIGASITIVATASEAVQAGGTINVTLNTGAFVVLTANGGATLTGTYVIQPGETASRLDVVAISSTGTLRDVAGNPLVSTALPPPTANLAGRNTIVVAGAVAPMLPSNLSRDPAMVPDLRLPLVRVPITFATPVEGVTLGAFRLLLNGRSVSLRGARVMGSGADYTLILPRRRTSPRGIYSLEIRNDAGIRSVINGAELTQTTTFYWGRGRSMGFSRASRLRAFANLR